MVLSALTLCAGLVRTALGLSSYLHWAAWVMIPEGLASLPLCQARKEDQWQRWEQILPSNSCGETGSCPSSTLLRLWLSKLRDLPVLILADPEGRVTAPCLGLPVRPLSRVPWRQAGPTEKQS